MDALQTDRTTWMAGKYGIMHHWLFPGVMPEKGQPANSLDEAVDQFNLQRWEEDFIATGAEWVILTLGQNTGHYLSPNSIITQHAGAGACSQRDLAMEMAQVVHRLGKRFIAYLPCEVAANRILHQGFGWNSDEGTSQWVFQQRYLQAVREWSVRFGSLLDGWWFDGCYTWPIFHNQYMDWPNWFAAARAGNPDAVITFNDGSFCVGNTQPVIPAHDYLSGEVEMLIDGRVRLGRTDPLQTHLPEGRFVTGTRCQWHCLLPIDCFWMHGSQPPTWVPDHPYTAIDPTLKAAPMETPLYKDAELGGFLANCLGVGGAVTMNVGIYQEGHLGEATVQQLNRLRGTLGF